MTVVQREYSGIVQQQLIMAERIKQLEEDINELQQFVLQAERPNIQNHLTSLLSKLRTELEQLTSTQKVSSQSPKKVSVSPPTDVKENQNIVYSALTKYAWDQEGSKVKIFFTLDGLGTECTKDQIDVIFDKWSVQVRIRGYKKQNLVFAVKKLFGEIVIADSKYVLKTNALNVTLVKKDNKSWSQLAFKQETFAKPEKEAEKSDDPQASIMHMMKKMYQEGDENMKKTIAEAWTKANDKKGGDPHDFSDRYDSFKKK